MEERINLQDIARKVGEARGLSLAESDAFVRTWMALMEEALETDHVVKIKGLGTFKRIEVESRESVHVNTGERIRIESHYKLSFVPDPWMREQINRPFSHFETVVLNEGVNFEDVPVLSYEEEAEEEETTLPLQPNPPASVEETPEFSNPVEEEEIQEALPGRPSSVDPVEIEPVSCEPVQDDTSLPQRHTRWRVWTACLAMAGVLGAAVAVWRFAQSAGSYAELVSDRSNGQVEVRSEMPQAAVKVETPLWSETTGEQPESMADEKVSAASVEATVAMDTTKTIISGVRKGRETVVADSTSYVIVGTMTTHRIQPGETLTMISRRFYETKDLWPYLVMHNRDVVKNPNQVPVGTCLRIPALRDR